MEALGFDKERLMAAHQKEMQAWEREFMNRDAGYGEGQPLWISSLQTGDGWQPMQLPGFWERNGLDGFDGVVWFQREIEIPAAWQGKEVWLSLGKIDDEDITYYNGQEIARGQGHATPRSYMIPANEVKAGKGVLTIRVTDYGGEGGINGAPEDLYAEVGGERISLAGIPPLASMYPHWSMTRQEFLPKYSQSPRWEHSDSSITHGHRNKPQQKSPQQ